MFTAFMLPFWARGKTRSTEAVFYATLLALVYISGSLAVFHSREQQGGDAHFTAGFKPPLSINLRLGLEEALFLCLGAVCPLVRERAVPARKRFTEHGTGAMMLFLMQTLGRDRHHHDARPVQPLRLHGDRLDLHLRPHRSRRRCEESAGRDSTT